MSAIRKFLAINASDEQVISLLDRAASGNIRYTSCMCLIGSIAAHHSVDEFDRYCPDSVEHITKARELPYAYAAEHEFDNLGNNGNGSAAWSDALRCERLVPILEAEITRRSLSLPAVSTEARAGA